MPPAVFLSYSRKASSEAAQALAEKLSERAFFDTAVIQDGDPFPDRLLHGVLDAGVFVLFASEAYLESRWCRTEMRLALAGDARVVVALGDRGMAVLDALPKDLASRSWPGESETERLVKLVEQSLSDVKPMRDQLVADDARRIVAAFEEEAAIPLPKALPARVALPDIAKASIGARFVGRGDQLRDIHRALSDGRGNAARISSRIAAGGGYGKTRLAIEYLHRYTDSYPGGIFWINADSTDLDTEFHRVLQEIDSVVPDIAAMRSQQRDIRRELEKALRGLGEPALYIIDNIPEATAGKDPLPTSQYCPAIGAVTILSTSRQDIAEAGVRGFSVDPLSRGSAVLLLTSGVAGSGSTSWPDWERIAEWVGDLPLALDLLNAALRQEALTAEELLALAESPSGATGHLDQQREAIRGQVPASAVRGVTEAFAVSYDRLDPDSQKAASLLAQYSPAPIPRELFDAFPDGLSSKKVRAALHSRHFLTQAESRGAAPTVGSMHRLLADFLRSIAPEGAGETASERLHSVMTPDRCRNPQHWPVMVLCRPHAEWLFQAALRNERPNSLNHGRAASFLRRAMGDFSGARTLDQQLLDASSRLLGPEHPDTLTSMNNLAQTSSDQGDLEAVRELQQQVLIASSRLLGPEHSDTLIAMNNLAWTLKNHGDLTGARELQKQVVDASRRRLGLEHPRTLIFMNNLAETLRDQGDLVGARELQEQLLEARRRLLGPSHPDTLISMNNLALTLGNQGDLTGARELHLKALHTSRHLLGPEHPDTLTSMNNLAHTLFESGEFEAARKMFASALDGFRQVLGEKHPLTRAVARSLDQVNRQHPA